MLPGRGTDLGLVIRVDPVASVELLVLLDGELGSGQKVHLHGVEVALLEHDGERLHLLRGEDLLLVARHRVA
jgi:hypothetical protein